MKRNPLRILRSSLGLSLCCVAALCMGVQFAHAELSLTSADNATTTVNVATSITGFQIVGPAASTTPVKLVATNGTLGLSTVSGVSMTGNNSGTVNLSGTVEDLNEALATLTYTRNSLGSDTLEVSLVEPGEVFFTDNGHLYEYISDTGTADQARTKAQALTRYGATGYLATILSAEENAYVAARLGGDGWMGASDAASEGDWKWITGPEAGTSFWSGAGGGSVVGDNYANWNTGEPNDSSGEDCAQFYSSTGRWNDLNCGSTTLPGYVAEFGSEEDPLNVVAANISIVTADVPAVSALSPLNAAVDVSTSSNLVITFSKSVTVSSGNILIKRASDDVTVETIDVTGGAVTGGGSTTITINPTADLGEGVEYYVVIPGTAFEDSIGNLFEGFSSSDVWSFTTDDTTPPVLSAVAASVTSNTTASVTWTTGELASTKLAYGLTRSYGETTSETNTSPRVLSHSVALADLLPCTKYHYATVSTDSFANTATSSDRSFVTTGCDGGAVPGAATSTQIASNAGGSASEQNGSKTFTVTAPADATATSSSFVIQIKQVSASTTLGTIGRPSAKPNEVGSAVFDVKAIYDGGTVLDSFDQEITIEYEYSDGETSDLDESSLWLYHYTGGEWVALNNCVLDTDANTISCTTPSFSIFGLFGSEPTRSAGSGTFRSCRDKDAINYRNFGVHAQDYCEYAQIQDKEPEVEVEQETPEEVAQEVTHNNNVDDSFQTILFETIVYQYRDKLLELYAMGINLPVAIVKLLEVPTAQANSMAVRDLEYGMQGEDVQQLQTILVAQGYGIPAGATGYFGTQTQSALAQYQSDNGVSPSVGYFGALTRTQMKQSGVEGLWW